MFKSIFRYAKENGADYRKLKEEVEKKLKPTMLGNTKAYKTEELDKILEEMK